VDLMPAHAGASRVVADPPRRRGVWVP
jgi:hypothetical protein